MVLKKKDVVFKSQKAVTKRIIVLEKVKRRLMHRNKTTDVMRSLRNVRESLSQLKKTRREWRKFIVSVKIFTV